MVRKAQGDATRVVSWAIDAVGARHLAERDFSRLSDGERQRVMIARALAQEPSLLVLDEPTAFLDVPSRVELMGLLRQLTRNSSIAVLMSTHDLELALRTADRCGCCCRAGNSSPVRPRTSCCRARSRRPSRVGRSDSIRGEELSVAHR